MTSLRALSSADGLSLFDVGRVMCAAIGDGVDSSLVTVGPTLLEGSMMILGRSEDTSSKYSRGQQVVHDVPIPFTALACDGEVVAVGTAEGDVQVYSLPSLSLLGNIASASLPARAISFSGSNSGATPQLVAIAGDNLHILIIERTPPSSAMNESEEGSEASPPVSSAIGRQLLDIDDGRRVTSIAFEPTKGRMFAAAAVDGSVTIYELSGGSGAVAAEKAAAASSSKAAPLSARRIAFFQNVKVSEKNDPRYCVSEYPIAWHPSGRSLAVGSDHGVHIYSRETPGGSAGAFSLVYNLRAPTAPPPSTLPQAAYEGSCGVAWSPDGTSIAVVDGRRIVTAWRFQGVHSAADANSSSSSSSSSGSASTSPKYSQAVLAMNGYMPHVTQQGGEEEGAESSQTASFSHSSSSSSASSSSSSSSSAAKGGLGLSRVRLETLSQPSSHSDLPCSLLWLAAKRGDVAISASQAAEAEEASGTQFDTAPCYVSDLICFDRAGKMAICPSMEMLMDDYCSSSSSNSSSSIPSASTDKGLYVAEAKPFGSSSSSSCSSSSSAAKVSKSAMLEGEDGTEGGSAEDPMAGFFDDEDAAAALGAAGEGGAKDEFAGMTASQRWTQIWFNKYGGRYPPNPSSSSTIAWCAPPAPPPPPPSSVSASASSSSASSLVTTKGTTASAVGKKASTESSAAAADEAAASATISLRAIKGSLGFVDADADGEDGGGIISLPPAALKAIPGLGFGSFDDDAGGGGGAEDGEGGGGYAAPSALSLERQARLVGRYVKDVYGLISPQASFAPTSTHFSGSVAGARKRYLLWNSFGSVICREDSSTMSGLGGHVLQVDFADSQRHKSTIINDSEQISMAALSDVGVFMARPYIAPTTSSSAGGGGGESLLDKLEEDNGFGATTDLANEDGKPSLIIFRSFSALIPSWKLTLPVFKPRMAAHAFPLRPSSIPDHDDEDDEEEEEEEGGGGEGGGDIDLSGGPTASASASASASGGPTSKKRRKELTKAGRRAERLRAQSSKTGYDEEQYIPIADTSEAAESALAVAMGDGWCAVGTDAQFLRFFRATGAQDMIFAVPGPIISVVGRGALCAVTYHSSAPSFGQQRIAIDVYLFKCGADGGSAAPRAIVRGLALPLRPRERLQWFSISPNGYILAHDSRGSLYATAPSLEWAWTILCDTKAAAVAGGGPAVGQFALPTASIASAASAGEGGHSEDSFWPLDVIMAPPSVGGGADVALGKNSVASSTTMVPTLAVVLCKGRQRGPPVTTIRPLVTHLPLHLPVIDAHGMNQQTALDESFLRHEAFRKQRIWLQSAGLTAASSASYSLGLMNAANSAAERGAPFNAEQALYRTVNVEIGDDPEAAEKALDKSTLGYVIQALKDNMPARALEMASRLHLDNSIQAVQKYFSATLTKASASEPLQHMLTLRQMVASGEFAFGRDPLAIYSPSSSLGGGGGGGGTLSPQERALIGAAHRLIERERAGAALGAGAGGSASAAAASQKPRGGFGLPSASSSSSSASVIAPAAANSSSSSSSSSSSNSSARTSAGSSSSSSSAPINPFGGGGAAVKKEKSFGLATASSSSAAAPPSFAPSSYSSSSSSSHLTNAYGSPNRATGSAPGGGSPQNHAVAAFKKRSREDMSAAASYGGGGGGLDALGVASPERPTGKADRAGGGRGYGVENEYGSAQHSSSPAPPPMFQRQGSFAEAARSKARK